MRCEKERINFEDKLYPAKVNKVVGTARKDVTFVASPFNGSSSLISFIDYLRTETMARKGWEELVSVLIKNVKIVQLLYRFNSISETKMKSVNKASKNVRRIQPRQKYIFIAVWRSLLLGTKREIKAHREEIGWDEPTFLWYLFKYYHSIAQQTVQTTLAKLNNLPTIIENRCKEILTGSRHMSYNYFCALPKTEVATFKILTRSTKC